MEQNIIAKDKYYHLFCNLVYYFRDIKGYSLNDDSNNNISKDRIIQIIEYRSLSRIINHSNVEAVLDHPNIEFQYVDSNEEMSPIENSIYELLYDWSYEYRNWIDDYIDQACVKYIIDRGITLMDQLEMEHIAHSINEDTLVVINEHHIPLKHINYRTINKNTGSYWGLIINGEEHSFSSYDDSFQIIENEVKKYVIPERVSNANYEDETHFRIVENTYIGQVIKRYRSYSGRASYFEKVFDITMVNKPERKSYALEKPSALKELVEEECFKTVSMLAKVLTKLQIQFDIQQKGFDKIRADSINSGLHPSYNGFYTDDARMDRPYLYTNKRMYDGGVNVIIKFDTFDLKDKKDNKTTLKDLFIIFNIDHKGIIGKPQGLRTTLDESEYAGKYIHSYLPGLDYQKPLEKRNFCLNASDVAPSLARLNNAIKKSRENVDLYAEGFLSVLLVYLGIESDSNPHMKVSHLREMDDEIPKLTDIIKNNESILYGYQGVVRKVTKHIAFYYDYKVKYCNINKRYVIKGINEVSCDSRLYDDIKYSIDYEDPSNNCLTLKLVGNTYMRVDHSLSFSNTSDHKILFRGEDIHFKVLKDDLNVIGGNLILHPELVRNVLDRMEADLLFQYEEQYRKFTEERAATNDRIDEKVSSEYLANMVD